MAVTYEPIASQTLGSAAATVTFSNIPGTFTDLVLACSHVGTSANIGNYLRFNSDSGSNYSFTSLAGISGSATSARFSNVTVIGTTSNYGVGSNEQATVLWQIMSYANTNVNKTTLSAYARASGEVTRAVGLWRSTSAINAITLYSDVNTFATGSTFSLYGIKAA